MNLKDYAKELTTEECVDSVRTINKFLLKEPLDEKELTTTVLREELVEKERKAGRRAKINEEDVAKRFVANNTVITCNEVVYLYDGRYYKPVPDRALERWIHENYEEEIKSFQRKEVIDFIKLKTWIDPKEINTFWHKIVFNNGILNLLDMKLYPHTPLEYHTILINHDYVEKPIYSSIVDNFFNTITQREEEKKNLLYEIAGYCFIKKNLFEKFFVCLGEGQTGKSTYLTMIRNLVGHNNVSYLGLQDLDDKYLPIELFEKLANIGDDISFRSLKDSSILKKMVSGQEIMAQQKYKPAISFSSFATLIYSANRLPATPDRTSGFYRRLQLIVINKRIEKPDPLFLTRLSEQDYEYFLYKAVHAIKAAIERNHFTVVPSSEEMLDVYKKSQSSLLSYVSEKDITKDNIDSRPVAEVFEEYRYYCEEDAGFIALKKNNFFLDICDMLKIRIVNTTLNGENPCRRFRK
jgi:putative DNA primase/helicase